MISDDAFDRLREQYGRTSSWAVWRDDDMRDTSAIEDHRDELHSEVVLVGLNASGSIDRTWSNFHSPQPGDRKLRHLLNESSYRGAYMTDILKGYIEPDSNKVENLPTELLDRNAQHFRDEMSLLGATSSTLFILFGRKVQNLFFENLSFFYRNAVTCTHYSYYGVTTEEWLEDVRSTLTAHWKKTERIEARNEGLDLGTPKFLFRS
jgi:hypothetical protein